MSARSIKSDAFAASRRVLPLNAMAVAGKTCASGRSSGAPNNVLLSDLSVPKSAAKRSGAVEEGRISPDVQDARIASACSLHRCSPGPQGRRLVPIRQAQRTLELRDAPCSVRSPRWHRPKREQWLKFFSKRLRMRLNKLTMRSLTGSCINKTFRQSHPQLAKRPIPSSVRANGRPRKMPAQCAT